MAAGVVADLVGNPITASNQVSVEFDRTGPIPTLTSSATDPTYASPVPVTITFDSPVVGFTLADVDVTGGNPGTFVTVSPDTYTVEVAPSAEGPITVDIPAAAASDAAGNPSTAGRLSGTYDSTRPEVTLTTTAPDPTSTTPIPVTAAFSEDVTGFAVGDVTQGNAEVSNLTGGPRIFTFDLVPSTEGTVTAAVAAGSAADAAGNPNTASNQVSVRFARPTSPPITQLPVEIRTTTTLAAKSYFGKYSTTLTKADDHGDEVTARHPDDRPHPDRTRPPERMPPGAPASGPAGIPPT